MEIANGVTERGQALTAARLKLVLFSHASLAANVKELEMPVRTGLAWFAMFHARRNTHGSHGTVSQLADKVEVLWLNPGEVALCSMLIVSKYNDPWRCVLIEVGVDVCCLGSSCRVHQCGKTVATRAQPLETCGTHQWEAPYGRPGGGNQKQSRHICMENKHTRSDRSRHDQRQVW